MLGALLLITQGINLIGPLVVNSFSLGMQIKKIFEGSGQDFTVEIKAMQDGALKTNEETIALIDEWNAANPE